MKTCECPVSCQVCYYFHWARQYTISLDCDGKILLANCELGKHVPSIAIYILKTYGYGLGIGSVGPFVQARGPEFSSPESMLKLGMLARANFMSA